MSQRIQHTSDAQIVQHCGLASQVRIMLQESKLFEELHFTFSSKPTDLTEGETHDVGYRV